MPSKNEAGGLSPLVHIGYGKAGSTSVQAVFGQPANGFVCDRDVRPKTPSQVKNRRIIDYLAYTHDFEFDPGYLRELSWDLLGGAVPAGFVPLVSSERLAGHWSTGGHDSRVIADRILATWPQARILVIFREQRTMLSSVYRQYVNKGGGRSFQNLVAPQGTGFGRSPGFCLRFFKYDQLVAYYQELFSRSRVLALPLELLKADPSGFFDRIFEFSGVSRRYVDESRGPHEKIGLDAYTVRYKRLVNPCLARDNLNDYGPWSTRVTRPLARTLLESAGVFATQRRRSAAELRLKAVIAATADDVFGESNANLEQLIGIDLNQYGYDLAKRAGDSLK